MSAEQILSNIAKQANINEERALISVRVISDEDFIAAYGTETWALVNLTIPESLKEHLEVKE